MGDGNHSMGLWYNFLDWIFKTWTHGQPEQHRNIPFSAGLWGCTLFKGGRGRQISRETLSQKTGTKMPPLKLRKWWPCSAVFYLLLGCFWVCQLFRDGMGNFGAVAACTALSCRETGRPWVLSFTADCLICWTHGLSLSFWVIIPEGKAPLFESFFLFIYPGF